MPTDAAWKVLTHDPWVATCDYSFGPGITTALAVEIDGGVLIASPPSRVAETVYASIAARGPVRALIATNAFHFMGLTSWKARFPDASIFAPAQSIARVSLRSGLAGIRPLSEAQTLAGERVALIDLPHFKTGEALVKVRTSSGLAWYVTDIVLNLEQLPSHWLFAVLFKISGSAPGLRLNRIAPLFMVKDKVALRRWLAEEAERAAPRWLIPAHGSVVDLKDTPNRLPELFRS